MAQFDEHIFQMVFLLDFLDTSRDQQSNDQQQDLDLFKVDFFETL